MLFVADKLNTVSAALFSMHKCVTPHTVWGHRRLDVSGPGLHGAWYESGGHYLLGNGYRMYLPRLMRFSPPDSLSPFGKGGLNAYGFCAGDPVNMSDLTGHTPLPALARSLDEVLEVSRVIASHLPPADILALSSTSKQWLHELSTDRAAVFLRSRQYAQNVPQFAEPYVTSRLRSGSVPADRLLNSTLYGGRKISNAACVFLSGKEGKHLTAARGRTRLDTAYEVLAREFPIPQTEDGRTGYAILQTNATTRMSQTVRYHAGRPEFWQRHLPSLY